MRLARAVPIALLAVSVGCAGAEEPPEEYPDAVTADPEHYTVEAENDAVRILRITYGPGESSVMHYHPANCAIYLTDQSATFELPSGEVEEVPAEEPGSVNCVDAGAHLPTNTGDQPLELVLLELKGRATFQP